MLLALVLRLTLIHKPNFVRRHTHSCDLVFILGHLQIQEVLCSMKTLGMVVLENLDMDLYRFYLADFCWG